MGASGFCGGSASSAGSAIFAGFRCRRRSAGGRRRSRRGIQRRHGLGQVRIDRGIELRTRPGFRGFIRGGNAPGGGFRSRNRFRLQGARRFGRGRRFRDGIFLGGTGNGLGASSLTAAVASGGAGSLGGACGDSAGAWMGSEAASLGCSSSAWAGSAWADSEAWAVEASWAAVFSAGAPLAGTVAGCCVFRGRRGFRGFSFRRHIVSLESFVRTHHKPFLNSNVFWHQFLRNVRIRRVANLNAKRHSFGKLVQGKIEQEQKITDRISSNRGKTGCSILWASVICLGIFSLRRSESRWHRYEHDRERTTAWNILITETDRARSRPESRAASCRRSGSQRLPSLGAFS